MLGNRHPRFHECRSKGQTPEFPPMQIRPQTMLLFLSPAFRHPRLLFDILAPSCLAMLS